MEKESKPREIDYLLLTQIILTLTFSILKLTGDITWPWLWVLCPLWIGLAAWLVIAIVFLFFCLIVMVLNDAIGDE